MRIYYRVIEGFQHVASGYAVRGPGEDAIEAVGRSLNRRLATKGKRTEIWARGMVPKETRRIVQATGVVGERAGGRNLGNLELHIGLYGVRP